ncbi:MAG: response regulator [Candidatus Omnitrophica bacterium]|nr:response regulator [Candidatus Omnitrophota bacterium]
MKILIIDDSMMDRRLLTRTIEKAGITCEIIQAPDGQEGFKLLNQYATEICLILLDWQMPIIDGIEFMKSVQKVPLIADIPIVMVSASSSEESQKQAKMVNPKLVAYVVKPFKPDNLIAIILPYVKQV